MTERIKNLTSEIENLKAQRDALKVKGRNVARLERAIACLTGRKDRLELELYERFGFQVI